MHFSPHSKNFNHTLYNIYIVGVLVLSTVGKSSVHCFCLSSHCYRLQALKREIKVKEIHVLDAARRRFMTHQQAVRESEIKKLDHELQKRVVQREEETKHVLEDIETRALELERQKAMLEQELAKCQEEVSARLG